jgi:Tfp pilus assembly major pilin PilA
MFCTNCGNQTNPNDAYCGTCGAPRAGASTPPNIQGETSDQGNDRQLYATVIGPKNTEYYLEYFTKADLLGRAEVSWHWPALFANFYWMLYRKLWVPAAVYFFAPAVAVILAGVLAQVLELGPSASAAFMLLASLGVGYVLPAMYGNRWYYNRCRELVDRAKRVHDSREDQLQWLAREGGTSRAAIWFSVILATLFGVGILAAIAIPAYQDYTTRAQVTEGLNLAGAAKAAITEAYTNTGEWPKDNASAGLPEQISGKYVESVQVVGSGLIITFRDAEPVSNPLRGKDLYLVAGLSSNGDVAWQCGSKTMRAGIEPAQFNFETSGGGGSVAQKHRPVECRG